MPYGIPHMAPQFFTPRDSGGGGFVPTDVAGCKFWMPFDNYDATTGVGLDQSGNGNDVSQTPPNAPTAGGGLNGHATGVFNGGQNLIFTGGGVSVSSSLSIFIVIKPATNGTMLGPSTSPGGPFFYLSSLVPTLYNDFITALPSANTALSTSVFQLTDVNIGVDLNYFLNGVADGNFASTTTFLLPIVQIGSNRGVTFISAEMAEIIIYDTQVSPTDRALIESYEMTKYAL